MATIFERFAALNSDDRVEHVIRNFESIVNSPDFNDGGIVMRIYKQSDKTLIEQLRARINVENLKVNYIQMEYCGDSFTSIIDHGERILNDDTQNANWIWFRMSQ